MMIYDFLRESAVKYGDQIAVTLNDENVTYGELESISNRVAGLLKRIGLRPGERIGLYLEKNPMTIAAMLGISKAGGIYIPLDTRSPSERVLQIIRSSDLSMILVDNVSVSSYRSLLTEHTYMQNILWGWWSGQENPVEEKFPPAFSFSDIFSEPDSSHQTVRDEHSPAHILFTSGSTGKPKGVVITHQNISSFIEWAVSYFNMKPRENISCHSPLHFDLSTFDIYGGFAAGSQIFLVPSDMSVNPKRLTDFIISNKLNQWFSVPSALSYLAQFKAIPDGGFPDLKRLIWCGEVFPVPALQYWMQSLPGVEFTNLYGPTEATIASSYYTLPHIPEKDDEVPIGKACGGEKLLVLDDDFKPVKNGETGHLYIAGSGLSPGYWRDSEKTENAFFTYTNEQGRDERIYKTGDLASVRRDGMVCFHGRSDYQIKSRGYRIELGEIESAMSQIKFLLEYAVVPVEKGGFEGTAIGCAYVAGSQNNGPMPPVLKKILAGKIPSYMIPHYWKEYEKLPRNGNGKIDRKALSNVFEKNGNRSSI